MTTSHGNTVKLLCSQAAYCNLQQSLIHWNALNWEQIDFESLIIIINILTWPKQVKYAYQGDLDWRPARLRWRCTHHVALWSRGCSRPEVACVWIYRKSRDSSSCCRRTRRIGLIAGWNRSLRRSRQAVYNIHQHHQALKRRLKIFRHLFAQPSHHTD